MLKSTAVALKIGCVFMNNGKLIVLEGLDGCGKSTQLELAGKYLEKLGVNSRTVSFPNYNSPSGQIISDYLAGKIPCGGENGAYAASAFYAADRYISYVTDWKQTYENGGIILSGRYATSNAIYQMTKVPQENRAEFMNWLADHEYNKLGLPQPDLVLFLDMALEVSQKLLSKRYNGDESKKDIHEKNLEFMKNCRESAMTAAAHWGWKIINCSENGEPLPIETIHNKIADEIKEMVEHG